MAAASSAPFFGLGDVQMAPPQPPQQAASHEPNSSSAPAPAAPAPKKKRNQPGNPNPDAEVIALSPRTLLATNRFVCEVCNKGFQREQNLQLHRRGHNLPWKLKQKNPKETRRRVYLCPEPTCVHHDPSRALGDLTGIKKHYCRKHGEKKWKCDKCNKRYAVQSDWKAHSKTCGTREYRCDCGTLFSRRDSFITHRAFCDALAQETARIPPLGASLYGSSSMALGLSGMASLPGFPDQAHSSAAAAADVLRLGGGHAAGAAQFEHILSSSAAGSSVFRPPTSSASPFYLGSAAPSAQDFSEDGHSQPGHPSLLHGKPAFHGLMQLPEQHQSSSNGNLLNLGFFSGNSSGNGGSAHDTRLIFADHFNSSAGNGSGSGSGSGEHGGNSNTEQGSIFSGNMMSSHLGGTGFSSLYNASDPSVPPHMSATALLQRAAEMGSTNSSNSGGVNSMIRGHGNNSYSPSAGKPGVASIRAGVGAVNASQFQDIMSSLASGGGGSSVFGGSFSGAAGFGSVDDSKLSTRDFLGVGGVVQGPLPPPGRHVASGFHIGSLDPEMK